MRIGLLGVGRLGASHAATLRAIKDVTELRVYDADPARAKQVAKDVGATAVDTVDAALDRVDAAVIVTPMDTHAPIIRRCLADPAKRYPLARALQADLERFAESRPFWRRVRGWAGRS